MAFQPGHAKLPGAGRKPGQPNAATKELALKCQEYGLDVFEAMMNLAKNAEDVNVRMRMLSELAQYLYPKRKAIEVSQQNVNPLEGLTDQEKLEKIELMAKLLREKINGRDVTGSSSGA